MKSSMLESFNNKVLSKTSSIRIVGGDDTSGTGMESTIILASGPKPKTKPISSTATHIKPDDNDPLLLETIVP